MENARHSHSSIPLVSRLDHVDFIMKHIEGRQNPTKWNGISLVQTTQKQSTPLDLALKEAYFKGSLMDRVTSLEHRLFQLCLELESSSTSSGTSSQNSGSGSSGYASSSQEPKSEPSFPLPTFNNSNQLAKVGPLAQTNRPQVQEKSQKEEQEERQKPEKKSKKDEKTCKSRKKKKKVISLKLPYLKLLGC